MGHIMCTELSRFLGSRECVQHGTWDLSINPRFSLDHQKQAAGLRYITWGCQLVLLGHGA